MKNKDFKSVMEILEFGDTAEYYPIRCVAELEMLDDEVKDLTQEQTEILITRLKQCRSNMLHSDLNYIKILRKDENIPKTRFWWYLDEL